MANHLDEKSMLIGGEVSPFDAVTLTEEDVASGAVWVRVGFDADIGILLSEIVFNCL